MISTIITRVCSKQHKGWWAQPWKRRQKKHTSVHLAPHYILQINPGHHTVYTTASTQNSIPSPALPQSVASMKLEEQAWCSCCGTQTLLCSVTSLPGHCHAESSIEHVGEFNCSMFFSKIEDTHWFMEKIYYYNILQISIESTKYWARLRALNTGLAALAN